jgi:hypothetical protein
LCQGDLEILNKLGALCFDQSGCRLIQKRLENLKPGESALVSLIVSGMLDLFAKAACNQFGNYLC